MDKNVINTNSDFTPWNDNYVQLYRAQGYWRGESLYQILEKNIKRNPEKIAVIDKRKSWTYSELDRQASQLASGFIEIGIKENDKVIVQLPNMGEFLEIIFALFKIGAIPIYALPAHRQLEIEQFCDISEARAYIITDKSGNFDYRKLARAINPIHSPDFIIVAGEAEEFIPLEQLYNQTIYNKQINSSNIALLQLSGGTTNIPKLIPRTHDDYYYSVRESAKICQLSQDSNYLCVLPAAHNFPHSSPGVLGTLYAGGSVILADHGSPDIAFDLIEKHQITITALVPPLAMIWLDSAQKSSHNFSSLKVIQVGGAKFSAEAAKKISPVFNCKLQQVFGMAEGLVNYTRLDDADEIVINTQGRPISEADEIRIVNESDNDVETGQPGELLTRGPYTIRGYFRAKDHNLKAFTKDGFYRTGDIASVTEKGYLTVEGRVKDQINRGGEKISTEEVENLLLAHDHIHDVAIVAMPDKLMGERSCAFVVISEDINIQPKFSELRQFLIRKGIADYKLPDRIEYISSFPKTSFGKTNKQALRNSIS